MGRPARLRLSRQAPRAPRRLSRPQEGPLASPLNPERERHALISAHIQRLVSLQEWEAYKGELLDMEAAQKETLITASDDWRYIQGRIQGLRDALRLPAVLIARGRRG